MDPKNLADIAASTPDPQVSGSFILQILGWITTFIVAIVGAVAAAWAKTRGRAEGRAEAVTLGEPVPTVPTRKVFSPPSWDQHAALVDRVSRLENTTIELRRDVALQFRELLEAGGQRENRLSEKLDGMARGFHSRVDRMMEVCAASRCGQKPTPSKS